ncbi:hypothetical protein B0H13DRAFT_1969421, partial [Mycena leptocephala]
MKSGDEIPTEILDEILEHFSARGNCETLQHLNLVNRRFHHLARQRLFTYLTFHPYSVAVDSYGMSAADLILPLDPTPEHLRQRLEFWASEDIAPCVRECIVQPLEFEESKRESPAGEDPYILLKAFYEFLPRFINLEVFNAFTLHFTTIAMTNLRLLPKLTAMNIDMCSVAEGETLDLDAPSKLKLGSPTVMIWKHGGLAPCVLTPFVRCVWIYPVHAISSFFTRNPSFPVSRMYNFWSSSSGV